MDTAYWQLFWTTGLPEAWLMSRGGESAAPVQEAEVSGPRAEVQAGPCGSASGGSI